MRKTVIALIISLILNGISGFFYFKNFVYNVGMNAQAQLDNAQLSQLIQSGQLVEANKTVDQKTEVKK